MHQLNIAKFPPFIGFDQFVDFKPTKPCVLNVTLTSKAAG
jgi:hypothetical protein